MKITIEDNNQEMKVNNQDYDDKMIKVVEYFKEILASSITSIMDHINM